MAKNSEEYISISYGNFYRKLVFLDSYRFLKAGLAKIAETLDNEDFLMLKQVFVKEEKFSIEQFNLLKQKGIYPYDYITSLETLNETQLPSIKTFILY